MLSAIGEELSEFGTKVGDGSPGLAGGVAAGAAGGADATGALLLSLQHQRGMINLAKGNMR